MLVTVTGGLFQTTVIDKWFTLDTRGLMGFAGTVHKEKKRLCQILLLSTGGQCVWQIGITDNLGIHSRLQPDKRVEQFY